jgi:hypothetical protein
MNFLGAVIVPLISRVLWASSRPVLQFYDRFEVFMAVTMNNAVFWDVESQFLPHKKRITSPLQTRAV